MQFQPSKNLFGILIWRKDWIENFFNFSCFDERQSFVQLQPINTKRRQAQSALELEGAVAEQLKGKLQAVAGLPLVFAVLSTDPEHAGAEGLAPCNDRENCRTAEYIPRAGNPIPTVRQWTLAVLIG